MAIKRLIKQNNYSGKDGTIVIESIDKIKLWRDNPRKNDQGVVKLAKLLKTYGQITPIVVWDKNMTVYKGNTTLKALLLNGEKTVKVLYKSFPSEQAAIAYGIADNKSSEWSDWDDDILKNIFSQNEKYFTKENIGFTGKEKQLFLLSKNCDKLPDIEIQGETKELDEFMIIIFDSKNQMDQFKERFNVPQKHRKIDFKTLIHRLNMSVKETI